VQTLGRVLAKECPGRQRNKKTKNEGIPCSITQRKRVAAGGARNRAFTVVAVFHLPKQALEAWLQFTQRKVVQSDALWKFPTAMIGCRFLLIQCF